MVRGMKRYPLHDLMAQAHVQWARRHAPHLVTDDDGKIVRVVREIPPLERPSGVFVAPPGAVSDTSDTWCAQMTLFPAISDPPEVV